MHAQKHRTNYRKHRIKIITRNLSRRVFQYIIAVIEDFIKAICTRTRQEKRIH